MSDHTDMLDSLSPTERIATLRDDFPGVNDQLYFDVAARGLIPTSARQRIDADITNRVMGIGDKAEMFKVVESVRKQFSWLHNTTENEVAITKNVSEGLNAVAAAFPWREGDNVVVCTELEHPNNIYLWHNLARLRSIEIRVVLQEGDTVPTNAVLNAMDARTRIVTTSAVSFMPGLRCDLDQIGAACRERDVLFLVDGAQSVGVIGLDLQATPVDAFACSAQKGLMGLYGFGFLYVSEHWAERLMPAYLARFGVDLGDAHEADVGGDDFQLMPAARRFDLGNYNFTAAAGIDQTLKMLLSIGPDVVERYVVDLSRRLGSGLQEMGFQIAGNPEATHYAHIVTVFDSESRIGALAEYLSRCRVRFSLRRGAIRLSCHLYNSDEEVSALLDIMREGCTQAPKF